MRRTTVLLASIVLVSPLLVGCVSTRQVVTPQTRDTLRGAPAWAVGGHDAKKTNSDLIYFVGVSTEETLSEAEAIDLAYKDALKRVGDYVGVTIEGVDEIRTTFDENGFAVWPHDTGKGGIRA